MPDEQSTQAWTIPDLKDQIGWRLAEQDKKDLRIVMADRREAVVSKLLRDLVHDEAEAVRRRWDASMKRRAEGAADG